jgi:hypothetical protein
MEFAQVLSSYDAMSIEHTEELIVVHSGSVGGDKHEVNAITKDDQSVSFDLHVILTFSWRLSPASHHSS